MFGSLGRNFSFPRSRTELVRLELEVTRDVSASTIGVKGLQ